MSRPYNGHHGGRTGAGLGVPNNSILGVLKATEMIDSRTNLPAGKLQSV